MRPVADSGPSDGGLFLITVGCSGVVGALAVGLAFGIAGIPFSSGGGDAMTGLFVGVVAGGFLGVLAGLCVLFIRNSGSR